MQRLALAPGAGTPRRVLALGCHSDDIEIGCGGTLLRLIEQEPELEVRWIVFSAIGPRGDEARSSADDFLRGAGSSQVTTYEFRDGFFPSNVAEIKERFEELKTGFVPDLVFTHTRRDLHQDHRQVCELTWNTWRNHLILEYEVPKFDGDLASPNVFVELSEDLCRRKTELLEHHFASQRGKHWFDEDLFRSLMRIRGMECGARYAEGFYGRKLLV